MYETKSSGRQTQYEDEQNGHQHQARPCISNGYDYVFCMFVQHIK
jgi:hypothetical protein